MLLFIYHRKQKSKNPGICYCFVTHQSTNMDSDEISKEERTILPGLDRPSPLNTRSLADFAIVASYLNEDSDLWVFRRFGKLHLFNILCLQQRLAELEHTLELKVWDNNVKGFETISSDIKIAVKEYGKAVRPRKRRCSPFPLSTTDHPIIMNLTF